MKVRKVTKALREKLKARKSKGVKTKAQLKMKKGKGVKTKRKV